MQFNSFVVIFLLAGDEITQLANRQRTPCIMVLNKLLLRVWRVTMAKIHTCTIRRYSAPNTINTSGLNYISGEEPKSTGVVIDLGILSNKVWRNWHCVGTVIWRPAFIS
jgi:hypothetical protein